MVRLALILMPALFAWTSSAYPNIRNLESDSLSQGWNAVQPKVFNGSISERFPFFVALGGMMNGGPFLFCGASLIADNRILTAAHCFSGDLLEDIKKATQLLAIISPTDIQQWYSYQRIPFTLEDVKKHDEYGTPESQSNDVAIIKLSKSVKLGKGIAPLCIDSKNYTTESPDVMLCGFGKDTCTSSPTILKYASGKFLSNSACQTYPKFEEQFRKINPTDVCSELHNNGGSPSIQNRGDSGGPLFRTEGSSFAQLGVVSYSYKAPTGCTAENSPGIYSSPALYPSFFNEHGGSGIKWC